MKTSHTIEYRPVFWTGPSMVIPKGTPVIPASNLPAEDGERFWAEPWTGMSDREASWQRNYGFLLDTDEVTVEGSK
jgi:hypothetical protein